jgi:hypothetical protein
VMSWLSHAPVELDGRTYYPQKDVEFERFLGLPSVNSQCARASSADRVAPRLLNELGL